MLKQLKIFFSFLFSFFFFLFWWVSFKEHLLASSQARPCPLHWETVFSVFWRDNFWSLYPDWWWIFAAAAWPLDLLWHYFDHNRTLGLLATQIDFVVVFIGMSYAHSHSSFLFLSLSLVHVFTGTHTLEYFTPIIGRNRQEKVVWWLITSSPGQCVGSFTVLLSAGYIPSMYTTFHQKI